MTTNGASNIPSDLPVLSETHGAVALIRLNRPNRLNAVDPQTISQLRLAFHAANEDAGLRSVVIIGEGRCFMSGADLSLFRDDPAAAPSTAVALIDGFHAMLREIRTMPKPVVAALSGNIAGGGFGLALACDFCVMAEDARLISGYSKLGTSPDAGTTWSLTHLAGRKRALEIMWLNDPIGAREAHSLGLVNRVVPPLRLLDEALAIGRRLSEGAPQAIGRIKALVEEACVSSLDAQLDREKAGFVACAATGGFREGIAAFFEKRAPRF